MTELSAEKREELRELAKSDLYFLAKGVLGFDQVSKGFHRPFCQFLESPVLRKLICLPRGFFKTTLATKAKAIQESLKDPGVSQLIVCQKVGNASAILDDVRHIWERNVLLQGLFPELVPRGDKNWNSERALLKRPVDVFHQQEFTYEAMGIGTQPQSRHYDKIYADDLVVAKKDDITGVWMQPSEEDIQKAIGWHQLAWGVMRNVQDCEYLQIMTRWSPNDLYDYLTTDEKEAGVWSVFWRSAYNDDGTASFPEKYPVEALAAIKRSQGGYKFNTQYCGHCLDPESLMFSGTYTTYLRGEEPKEFRRIVAACDPAIGQKKSSHPTGIVVVGMTKDGRRYVLEALEKRMVPSEIVATIVRLWRRWRFRELGLETTAFQETLKYDLEDVFTKKGRLFKIKEFKPGTNLRKPMRIEALQPSFEGGWWYVRSDQRALMDQLDQYPMGTSLDVLDALAYTIRLLPKHRGEREVEVDVERGMHITLEDIKKRLPPRYDSTWQFPQRESKTIVRAGVRMSSP